MEKYWKMGPGVQDIMHNCINYSGTLIQLILKNKEELDGPAGSSVWGKIEWSESIQEIPGGQRKTEKTVAR